jgi:hypothetical protein
MPEITCDFHTFLPSLGTFYQYFEVLKEQHFIKDVQVIEREGTPFLQVYNNPVQAK